MAFWASAAAKLSCSPLAVEQSVRIPSPCITSRTVCLSAHQRLLQYKRPSAGPLPMCHHSTHSVGAATVWCSTLPRMAARDIHRDQMDVQVGFESSPQADRLDSRAPPASAELSKSQEDPSEMRAQAQKLRARHLVTLLLYKQQGLMTCSERRAWHSKLPKFHYAARARSSVAEKSSRNGLSQSNGPRTTA